MYRLASKLVISVSALLIISCGGKECEDYKYGKWHIAETGVEHIIIERKGDIQIEYSEKDDFRHEYYIFWSDPCNYSLVLKETTNPELLSVTKKDTFYVEIASVHEDGYQYLAHLGTKDFVGHVKEVKELNNK